MPFGKLVWALLASLAVADCCSGLRTVPFGRIARLRGGFEGTAGLAAAGVEGGCDPEENKSPLMRGKEPRRGAFSMDDVVQALSDQGVSKKVPEDVPQLLPPKHVEAYAEADWHARGGRTYSEIQMDIANIQQHQYFPTFNSLKFRGGLAQGQMSPNKEHTPTPREAAYAALLVKLKAGQSSMTVLIGARGSMEGNSTVVGSASAFTMRGRREYMEDTFAVHHPQKRTAGQGAGEGEEPALFGLFDGHGGSESTNYCRDNLLSRALEFIRGRGARSPSSNATPQSATPCGSATGSRVGTPHPREAPREGVALGWLKRAMHYAFTQTDHEVILAGINDGTTGVCLAVSSTHLLVSNCGDSRAVLWDETNGGADLALSVDHKPSRVAEKRRIEGLGGHITHSGVPRVNGVLAVSRAIGDKNYKPFLISDPEQRSVKRQPGQRFVILASDGLWDVISSRDACELVLEHWGDDDHGAEAVAQEAFRRGSFDNITVLIVDLLSNHLAEMREGGEEDELEVWEEEDCEVPESPGNEDQEGPGAEDFA